MTIEEVMKKMTEEEIKAWYKKVYTEIFDESNKLNSPAASFAAGMAIGNNWKAS